MNLFTNTGVRHFAVQHQALDLLTVSNKTLVRISALKLYIWLSSASTNSVVVTSSRNIKRCTGLDEDTIQNAREYLEQLHLITAELEPGQGAKYSITVLNLSTGEPFRASEHAGPEGFFTVPDDYMIPANYREHSGPTVLVYTAILAKGNRHNTTKLRYSRAKLSALCRVTQKTFSKAILPLTEGRLPFVRVLPGSVEILHPQTGRSMSPPPSDSDDDFNVVDTTGKVVNFSQILTAENFREYFALSVDGINPDKVQQDVCCPFHADSRPSMSINLDNGVWFCHVCEFGSGGIVAFEMRLLKTKNKRRARRSIAKKLGVRLKASPHGPTTHEHSYTDVHGEVLYIVRRYEDGSARFCTLAATGKWKKGLNGVKRVPYHLPELTHADVVIVTEGEKKADEVSALGLRDATGKPVAVTCTGNATSWSADYLPYFQGKSVLVFPDTDEPGQRYAQAVTASFTRAGVEHRTVDFLRFGNDVRDFMRGRTKEELVEYTKCEWLQQREDEVEV
jgi:hypothetical protein